MRLLLLTVAALALSGCGIKGGLATAPPVFGGTVPADAGIPEDNTAAESIEDNDPLDSDGERLSGQTVEDADDPFAPNYGVDVAD